MASRPEIVNAPACPTCGGLLIPIEYGFPGEEMWKDSERGEIKLGGCEVTGDDPGWWCAACEEAVDEPA